VSPAAAVAVGPTLVAAGGGTKFLQLLVAGVALGAIYALVALGFVVVFKSTGTINFAHGGFVLLGAYLTYNYHVTWGVPFYVSMLMAMASLAVLAMVLERLILRRLVGQPAFTVIMVTLGILIVIQQVQQAVWTDSDVLLHDPWGDRKWSIGHVVITRVNFWTVVFAAVLVLAFLVFFRWSRWGVAMRAAAFDQEAALAQGVSVARVFAISWAIAGVVAVVAGVMLGARQKSVNSTMSFVALRAFPAMILGGLDAPLGAVLGGIIIGVTEVMTTGYVERNAPWLGAGFHLVMPYVVMIVILLVRPTGLFGTRAVERV
jgi:branched-chain amino acid transport system permease protein